MVGLVGPLDAIFPKVGIGRRSFQGDMTASHR